MCGGARPGRCITRTPCAGHPQLGATAVGCAVQHCRPPAVPVAAGCVRGRSLRRGAQRSCCCLGKGGGRGRGGQAEHKPSAQHRHALVRACTHTHTRMHAHIHTHTRMHAHTSRTRTSCPRCCSCTARCSRGGGQRPWLLPLLQRQLSAPPPQGLPVGRVVQPAQQGQPQRYQQAQGRWQSAAASMARAAAAAAARRRLGLSVWWRITRPAAWCACRACR